MDTSTAKFLAKCHPSENHHARCAMADKQKFRILVFDTRGDSVIKTEQQLLHATASMVISGKSRKLKSPRLI